MFDVESTEFAGYVSSLGRFKFQNLSLSFSFSLSGREWQGRREVGVGGAKSKSLVAGDAGAAREDTLASPSQ